MSGHVELRKWNHITEEWEKEPAVVTAKRMVATGQVVAGAHKLYWLNLNPSAGNSLLELTDDTAGGGAVLYDCFHTGKEAHVHSLSPPMLFDDGIYLETFTNMTAITFGYV